jgi:hypothetical protein
MKDRELEKYTIPNGAVLLLVKENETRRSRSGDLPMGPALVPILAKWAVRSATKT